MARDNKSGKSVRLVRTGKQQFSSKHFAFRAGLDEYNKMANEQEDCCERSQDPDDVIFHYYVDIQEIIVSGDCDCLFSKQTDFKPDYTLDVPDC